MKNDDEWFESCFMECKLKQMLIRSVNLGKHMIFGTYRICALNLPKTSAVISGARGLNFGYIHTFSMREEKALASLCLNIRYSTM